MRALVLVMFAAVALLVLGACGPRGGGSGPTSPSSGGVAGDRDGDGKPDATDLCPGDPEDMDGFTDDDGCPDPDNDKDGVIDMSDACPNEPEDIDGDADADGCPET